MLADLSQHHRPLTQLFQTQKTVDDWNQYRLTNDQVEFFHEYGYLAGIRALNDEQIDELRRGQFFPILFDPSAGDGT